MAITTPTPATGLLTYEEYMAEGVVKERYDIIEGVRTFMTAPTWEHQAVILTIAKILDRYSEQTGSGKAMIAPLDILIRRAPRLQVRQPEAFYITHGRLAQGGGPPRRGPLEIAPELVVEIISDTERRRTIDGKTADYITIGVQEEWIVRSEQRTVEVVQLTPDGPVSIATYDETQKLQSQFFPDLTVAVADLFK